MSFAVDKRVGGICELLAVSSHAGERILMISDSSSLILLGINQRSLRPTHALKLSLVGENIGQVCSWLEWESSWVEVRSSEEDIRKRGYLIASGKSIALVTMLVAEWRDYYHRQDELSPVTPSLPSRFAEYKRVSYQGFGEKPLKAILPERWRNLVVISGISAETISVAEYPLANLPEFDLHFYLPSALPLELAGNHLGVPKLLGIGLPLRDRAGRLLGEVSFHATPPIVLLYCPAESCGTWAVKRMMRDVASSITPILHLAGRSRGFDTDSFWDILLRREIENTLAQLDIVCGDSLSDLASDKPPFKMDSGNSGHRLADMLDL